MPTKIREILDQLRHDGWLEVARKGSHRQFKHPDKPGRVTVAGKPGDISLRVRSTASSSKPA